MGYEKKTIEEGMLNAMDSLLHRPTGRTKVKYLTIGDFSDFNRIFYLEGNLYMEKALLLFSAARQQFMQVDLTEHPITTELKLNSHEAYQEVEVYDHKLFCVRQAPLALDIFFSSKKRRFFHKRTFHFKDENLEFKEEIRFIVWKHDEANSGYRCLLGPLKDGRFINFTLSQKSFTNQEPMEQRIDKFFFVSLALDSEKENPPDILAALKPDKNTILCFDKEKKSFFEYGEFSGHDTSKLKTINFEQIRAEKLNRMYLHYPYDNYPNSLKNKIKNRISSICPPNMDIEKFARNRYREILLCMKGKPLYTMYLANRDCSFGNKESQWDIRVVATETETQVLPMDITVDEVSGAIYALTSSWIYCLKPEEKKETKTGYMIFGRESSLVNTNWES